MTDLLKEVVNKAKLLSPEMQDEVADLLLFEIENELKWQKESSLEKLTDQNLGDREPHPLVEWFFYSHPSIRNRTNNLDTLN